MANKYTGAFTPVDPANLDGTANATSVGGAADYTPEINTVNQLKDPRFLNDLREYYRDQGERVNYLTPDDLVDKFFSDQTWELLNVGSAVKGAYEASQADAGQKSRMNRLQQVYNRLPNFYEEGGRGTLDMLGDAIPAVIADPTNLLAPLKGMATAGNAARIAVAAGKNGMAAGIKQGVKRGAATEALITGGQEAVINTASQVRDKELGLRDEFSLTELGATTAIGAGTGGLVGGVLGGAGGAIGARNAQRQVDSARFLGLSDGQIGRMTDEQAKQAIDEAGAATGPFQPVEVQQAREQQAQQEVPTAEAEADRIQIAFPDAEDKLEVAIEAARQDVIAAGNDGVEEGILNDKRQFRDSVVMLRGMIDRLRSEEEEINSLGKTSDPKAQAELTKRRRKFERDLETFQVLMDGIDRDVDPEDFSSQVQALQERLRPATSGEAAPAAEPTIAAPETETPAEGGGGTASEAPADAVEGADVEAGEPPTPEPTDAPPPKPAFRYTTRSIQDEVENLIATNSLDGDMLDEMISEGKITLNGNGRFDAKAKRQLQKEINLLNKEDGEPVRLDEVFEEETPSPVKISDTLRGEALFNGLDYRNLTPSPKAKEGQLTKGVLRKELAKRKAGETQPDEYAGQVKSDLEAMLDDLPEEVSAEDARGFIDILAGDPAIKSDREDLLALFDYGNAKSSQSDRSVFEVDDSSLTKTEQRRIKKRTREIMNEQGLSEDAAISIARLELLNGDVTKGQTPIRGTGEAVEDAAKYPTAGRNTAGRIQGFLKRGTPISKGSGYTTMGRISPTTFGFEEALLKARQVPEQPLEGRKLEKAKAQAKKMIAGGMDEAKARKISGLTRGEEKTTSVVEFITGYGDPIRTRNGIVKAKKGEIAYADGVTGYAYDSMDFLVESRDGVASKVDAPKIESTPEKVPEYGESLQKLIEEFGGDPASLRKALKAKKATVETPAKPQPPTSRVGDTGDMLVIIREKANPQNVRMMSIKQAKEGKTVLDLIGRRNPDLNNWEVKYAPADTPRGKANLAAIFDELPDVPDAAPDMGAKLADGSPIKAARPITGEEAANVSVTVTDEFLLKALNFSGVMKGSTPDQINLAHIIMAEKMLSSKGWRKYQKDHLLIGQYIARINEEIAQYAPQGVQVSPQARTKTVEQVTKIFAKYSPEELDEAVKFIGDLGGDRNIGPVVDTTQTGGFSLQSRFTPSQGVSQKINFNFNKHDDRPRIAVLYHEVAHWAYANILTPEEKAQFWKVASKYYEEGVASQGKREAANPMADYNFHENPNELFAYQFEVWASRKRIPGMIQDEAFWQRVAKYVRSVFQRYAFDTPIDPELEPIFAKILPETEQAKVKMGVDAEPLTKMGEHINKRYTGLQLHRGEIEDAFERDSADAIIEAHRAFVQEFLLSVAPKRGTEQRPNSGIFSPLERNANIIRQRIRNIDEIITGKAFKYEGVGEDLVGFRPSWLENGIEVVEDPQRVADALRDFYENGFASENPDLQHLSRHEGMRNLQAGSTKYLIDRLGLSLENAYKLHEGRGMVSGHKPKISGEKDVRPKASKAARGGKKKNARAKAAVEKEAITVAKTPPAKRKRSTGKNAPSYDPGSAAEIKTLGLEDLRKQYLDHRGTARGEQIALEILAKEKNKPTPYSPVKVSRDIVAAREDELMQKYLDALYEGQSDVIDMVGYEISRRVDNRARKKVGLPRLEAVIKDVNNSIIREINDSVGVSYSDGIPASARASVREMLSYITHREPEVQYAARTMTYRMLNLMGKTTQQTMGETNVISTSDLARLAGVDPTTVGTGAFADLRAPEFKKLRSDMRRLSIGLTKGESSPFDVVHEIGHMVTRSGVLSAEDMSSILEAYRGSSDAIKERVQSVYGAKYADRLEGATDQVLAEEWFSEKFAEYLSERVTRGNILEAMATGDISKLKMRNTFDRTIDKMVEMVAYVVNGLIGRNDIKQQFRRLTLFGDMFERPAKSPLSDITKSQAAIHPDVAASAVRDSVAFSQRGRLAKITDFVGNGLSSDGSGDRFIPFFHGTPNGYAFNRADNPDVILRPSVRGFYGPGVYVSDNADVASQTFAKKPTPESMRSQIMDMDLDDEAQEELLFDAYDLHEVRKSISNYRRKYYMANAEGAEQADLTVMREALDDLVEMEVSLLENLTNAGVVTDPLVIPTFVRVSNPADFQTTALYDDGHGLINQVLKHIEMTDTGNPRAINKFVNTVAEGINGRETYEALVRLYMDSGRSKLKAQAEINETLEDLGYDGMLTTHSNTVNVDGTDVMSNLETYEGASISYQGLVVFDPANVKHVEASDFDELDPALYHRDTQVIPQGDVGEIVISLSDNSIADLRGIDSGTYGESLEAGGVDPATSGAIMSMLKGRSLDAKEEQAIRKNAGYGFLSSQSGRMKSLGMNWLGDFYKDHFPDIQQRFAQKYMPIHHALNALPDAGNKVTRWANSSNPFSNSQPKSHTRIASALRRGNPSRLSKEEADIYSAIQSGFANELKELRASGVMIGDLGADYFPQVYNKTKINENRAEFIAMMEEYHKLEATANGRLATPEEANQFATDMYLKLGTDEVDGVYIPASGGSKNPTSDSVDFSRLIDFKKYGMLDQAEKFLENNLQGILVKYYEGTSRRLSHMNKFGMNSHGYSDYLKVADEGAEGIAQLLSTNREFRISKKAIDEKGYVADYDLIQTAKMPFAQDEAGAREFASQLILDIRTGKGLAHVREKLAEIAPRDTNGNIPQAYQRRAEAIAGALQDFGGRHAKFDASDIEFVHNAMRIAMKKPMSGTGSKAASNASKFVRNVNNITLLGFTTLSSLGDTVLPVIRSGDFKSFTKALGQMAQDEEFRKLIYDTGVAMENIVHERMIYMYGAADGKYSNAFFNATMLTPWTDTMRQLSGAVGYNTFETMQQKAMRYYDPEKPITEQHTQYRTAHRYLTRYGLAEFLPSGSRGSELIERGMMSSDEQVRKAVIRFADETVFSPNPDEMPQWSNTPFGGIVMQLKSFPILMGRFAKYVYDEARQGNTKPLMYFAALGPAFGAGTLAIKDIVQSRGGDDEKSPEVRMRNLAKTMGYDEKVHGNEQDFMGWYLEGMMQMGGLGLLADILHTTVTQADNGAYGQQRIMSTLLGPTYGLAISGISVGGGAIDAVAGSTESNAKERTAVREVMGRVPVLGGVRAIKENVVDALAGEQGSGGSPYNFDKKYGSSFSKKFNFDGGGFD